MKITTNSPRYNERAEWEHRYANHMPAQSKEERQWRSRQQTGRQRVNQKLSNNLESCAKLQELEACETVEDLKRFIRENML